MLYIQNKVPKLVFSVMVLLVTSLFFVSSGTSEVSDQNGWNRGSFNGTSADRLANSGDLGIGYPNGTAVDNLEVFYRFDESPQKVVVGEAGTFNTSDGNWVNVSFQNSYSDPVVVGTSNTFNGEPALVFEAKNVNSDWAEMRVCESEGGTNDGCDTHPEEKVGYMVVDADDTDSLAGIEAGTFSQGAGIDTDTTTVTYSETFGSAPYVFTSVQTTNGATPIESRVTSYTQTDFTAGICHTDGANSCDSGHVSEEVGWVVMEPGNLPFNQDGELGLITGISNSEWTSDTFSSPFSSTPVVLAENPTENGGEELQIDEARSVTTTGFEARYCEIEPTDTCDSHTGEDVAWLAVDEGELSKVKLEDYSGNSRDASKIGPTVSGTGIMGTNSYAFDGTDDFIFLEPFTYFENTVNTRSYSFWFKANETSDAQVIFEEGGGTNGLNIYINNSNLYYGAWSENDGYSGDWISTSVNSDQWYHATMTFSTSNMSAYLDGQYVGSANPGTSIDQHTGDSSLGSMKADTKTASGDQNGDGYYFNGSIDEFRSFSTVISDNEIQQEYLWGRDSIFNGNYYSDIFDRLEKKNWKKVRVNASVPGTTDLSMDFEAITAAGTVVDQKTFTVSDGINDYLLDGLEYTQKYRVNFSGNSTSPTESWTVDSYEVFSDDVPPDPSVELVSPENDSTPVNNVSFAFKPFCYSDLGCENAELYFNFTQNFTENRLTDTEEDFDRGSFTNTSSSQEGVKLQGMRVASGRFQSSTGDVTVNDVGFQPDVIEFTVTNTNPSFDTTTERGGEPYGFGHGFADCTGATCNQVSFTQASGSASTNGGFAASSDQYSILMGDTGAAGTSGTVGIEGNVSSTSSNGFTVTFDTDTIGNQVTYRAYKLRGDVDVGYFSTPTSNGQQSYSTGFQPDYLNVITQPQLTAMNTQSNFATSDNGWSHGYATDTGTSEQVAMGVSQHQSNIDDHVFTSSSGQVIDLLEAKSKGGITDRMDASLTSFDSNGFTLDYTDTASGQPAIYLAMDTEGNAEAGYDTTPTSTGNQQVNTDLSPDYVNFMSSNTISGIDVEGHSGANGPSNHWGWMFGSGNTTDQRSMGFSSHSNSVNGHASGSSASDIFQLLYSDQDGNILGQDKATLSSTSPGSFTMNWNSITTSTTTNVKYDQILYSYVAFSDGLETEGSYESEAFKARKPVYWNNSAVTSSTPSGTTIDLEYGENSSGSYQFYNSISNVPRSSYLKYRANLSTTNPENTPSLEKVNITYLRPESWNVRDSINSVSNNTQQQFEYNFSTIFDLPQEIKWNVRVNQSDGKRNYADNNLTAIIADNPPNSPLWRNQSQEKDTVPKSGANELRAQGFDSVRLKNASLLTGIYDPGYWMAGTAQPRIANYTGQWNDLTGKASAPSNSILSMTAQRQNVFIGSSNSQFTVWNTSKFERFGQSTTPFSSKIYALSSNSTSVFIGTSGPDLSLFNINDQSFQSLGSPPDSCKVLASISTYSNNGFGDFFAYGTGCGNIYKYNEAGTTDITPSSIFSGKIKAFASNDTHIMAADTKGNIALYNGNSWDDITSKFGFFTNGRSVNTISSGDLNDSDPSFFLIGGGSGRLEKLYSNGTSVELTSDFPGSWTILSSDYKQSEKIFRLGGTSGNLYRYNSTGFYEDKPASFSNAVEAIASTEDNIKSESKFSTQQYSADSKYVWSNFTWVNSSVENQSIGWRIKYTDSNGKSSFTPIKSFFVDNTDTAPPIITIDSPANTSFDISDIPLEVSASETVDQWKYNLDNSGNQTFTPDTTLNSVSEGTHSIKVWANDTSGNYGSKERDFTVDLTKPTVSNIQDNATSDFFQIDTANISLEASDSLSGLNKIKLATDETGSFENKTVYGSPKTLSNISGETVAESFQWKNESFSGTLNYKFWVRDAAGNWRETNSNSFNVQPLEPYLFARLSGDDWKKGTGNKMRESGGNLVLSYDENSPGLEEFWTFETSNADSMVDQTSGIISNSYGSISTGVSGILGSQTFGFDGTDDYIAVDRSYTTAGEIDETTVCTWAKSSTTDSQIIMSYDRSEVWRFSLSSAQLTADQGYVGWQTSGESTGNQDMIGNTVVTDGGWHHICAVYDNSVTNEKKIYVDGYLDAETDQHSIGEGLGSGTTRYGYIGTGSEAGSYQGATGPGQFLNGEIDSLQVYSRALSPSEIKDLAVADPPLEGGYERTFNVPGYQKPYRLEPDSAGIDPDTELKVRGSNTGGAENFIATSNGRENFTLSLNEENKLDVLLNGSTDLGTKSPSVKSLNVWTTAKMYTATAEAVDASGSTVDNTKIEFFNRFNDLLTSETLSGVNPDLNDRIPRQENYSVSMNIPSSYSFQKLKLNKLKSDGDNSITAQAIENYTGNEPPKYALDPVLALNDQQLTYEKAELAIPYTDGKIEKIAHCTNWDFGSRECNSAEDWDINDPSFYGAKLNSTHALFNVTGFDAYATAVTDTPNFKVNNILLNDTAPIAGEKVLLQANISNNETVSEENLKVNFSIEKFNGTQWRFINESSQNISIGGNSFNISNFTWTSEPGRFRFNYTADPNDQIAETDENDNINNTGTNVSSHHIFYGGNNVVLRLSNLQGDRLYSSGPGYKNSTLFFADDDLSYSPSNLMPLNETGDLEEADQALNLTGHNDSLENMFDPDKNGDADKTSCIILGSRDVCEVPIINSTVTNDFVTGIVYDSSSGSPYDGSQPLIFVTETTDSKMGKFGIYDYEIKIPFSLGKQSGGVDRVDITAQID